MSEPGVVHRLAHLRAGSRLALAIVASVVAMVLLPVMPGALSSETRAVASWDVFALVALALTWTSILTLMPDQIRAIAQREDPSRLASLVLVVMGAAASLLAVLVLLKGSMDMHPGAARTGRIVLALSAVALGWLLIHTVFTLRYAHLYHETTRGQPALDFPGISGLPDYLDFAYFAFIIGMTAQTADVCIQDRRIRRTALLHGVVAFAFNTWLVALLIGALTTVLTGNSGT